MWHLLTFFIAYLFFISSNGMSIITVVYDDEDPLSTPFLYHLNISYLFYHNQYNTDISFNVQSYALHSGSSTSDMIVNLQDTNFIISLARYAETVQKVRQVSQDTGIATIQLQVEAWDGVYATSDNVINSDEYIMLVPSYLVFDNILPQLINELNITEEMTVLYDNGIQDKSWQQPFKKLPMTVNFVQMGTDPNSIQQQLDSLQKSTKTLFLAATTDSIEKYVVHAQQEIEDNIWTWVAFSKDTRPFKCDACTSAKIYWVRIMPSGKVENIRLIEDFLTAQELDNDPNFKVQTWNELQISTSMDMMQMAFDYLIKTNGTTPHPETPTSDEANFTLIGEISRTDVNYEYGNYNRHSANVYYQNINARVFKIDRITYPQSEVPDAYYNKYIGNWTFTTGLIPLYGSLGVDVRTLNHYRVVTIIQPPFIEMDSDPISGKLTLQGYCIDLLALIQEQLGFTYDLYLAPDGQFGSMDTNGNWNGLIGELVMGSAEIAIGPIAVMAERENDIDFTVPYYDLVGITILMKKTDVQYSLFKFMQVLEWPVWLCILGAYLFTSSLLWIFDKFSPYSYTNNKQKYENDMEKREFTLKECLWFCMTSLTPQGGGEAPKNISGRLVAATWWLFGFIIIASYTANLAAFLTVSRLEQPIGSLDDLAKQYKIEYAPLKGGATETYFRRMAEIEEKFYSIWKAMSLNESMKPQDRAKLAVWDYPVSDKFTNMWRYMQEVGLPETTEDAVQRVLTSENGFAFIGDAMNIQYAILTNCQLQSIGSEFSRKPYAVALQTGHPLITPVSTAILKLLNLRKLETLKEKWWNQNPKKQNCPSVDDQSNGISIQNIGGVFIVILAGIVVSLVILTFEYFYYSHKKQKEEAQARAQAQTNGQVKEEETNVDLVEAPVEEIITTIHNGHPFQYRSESLQY